MLKPKPDNQTNGPQPRHEEAKRRRDAASVIAHARRPQETTNNHEIEEYAEQQPTNFHKGVPHDPYGFPDPKAFDAFVDALNGDDYQASNYAPFNVPIGPLYAKDAWTGNDRSPASVFGAVEYFFSEIRTRDEATGAFVVRPPKVRNWESPLGGHQYDLMGPDAGDLAMAAAPKLGKSELTAEMAEIYAMALLRDLSFEQLKDRDAKVYAPAFPATQAPTVGEIVDQLAALSWYDPAATPVFYLNSDGSASAIEVRRRTARWKEAFVHGCDEEPSLDEKRLSTSTLFRGSVPGAKVGPYVSQFLLIGTTAEAEAQQSSAKDARNIAPTASPRGTQSSLIGKPEAGYIVFGAQRIDQRVNVHRPQRDYMTDWPLWLDVQNGADVRGADLYMEDGLPRFVGTPRDLATFVHFDQLYQAYFNACMLLFAYEVPFDYGLPSGRAHATRGSFATFGGPHILSLFTEVASRALKAVRRQKFQHHLRGRPELLGAMLTLQANGHGKYLGKAETGFADMLDAMQRTTPAILAGIAAVNEFQNERVVAEGFVSVDEFFPRRITVDQPDAGGVKWDDAWVPVDKEKNYLLPMAFPEGSPMHASYGAGHATVAGACVTILKAFFEMSSHSLPDSAGVGRPLSEVDAKEDVWWEARSFQSVFNYGQAFVADDATARTTLKASTFPTDQLTIEGELNKLAANISIGRNMAGVHFYTDYYDSLRMGERLAVGLLQEQMTSYRDPVSMRLKSFDNDDVLIYGNGMGGAGVEVRAACAEDWQNAFDPGGWWNRHVQATESAAT